MIALLALLFYKLDLFLKLVIFTENIKKKTVEFD